MLKCCYRDRHHDGHASASAQSLTIQKRRHVTSPTTIVPRSRSVSENGIPEEIPEEIPEVPAEPRLSVSDPVYV